jgi:predicted RNA-binding protein with PUA-like domain
MSWLVKTEPSTYSYADLERAGRAVWDGVANPVALKNLKAMAVGDRVFVYHTGGEKIVVGVAEVVKAAYADAKGLPVVDLKAVAPLSSPVTLATIKAEPTFADSALVKQGRLSVVPLTAAQERYLTKHGGLS